MLLLPLLQSLSVFLVFCYVYTWSPGFPPLRSEGLTWRRRLPVYLFFAALTILGNHLGIPLKGGAIANTRAVGSVLAGLLAGPTIGALVGITAGAERMALGGITALAGAVATTTEGLAAGLLHRRWAGRRPDLLLSWKTAALVTFCGEIVHQGFVLLLSRPFDDAVEIVKIIALPMIFLNPLGPALFMVMLGHRRRVYESIGARSSAFALRTARRMLEAARGVRGTEGGAEGGTETAAEIARVLREETGVAAVGFTSTEKILAWSGVGADHHRPGTPIAAVTTRRSLNRRDVVVSEHFTCPFTPACPLGTVVVVPLEVGGEVVGTVQIYETGHRRLRPQNRTMGEGLAAILSGQLLAARYRDQEKLLLTSEVKLLQAQVNPHFLFNALNTLVAVTRKDPDRARELLIHLSTFLRKNLKRDSDVATLAEELEHVGSYLEIEQARFGDRLLVETEVEEGLASVRLPTFTLQPLVENAIRHGVGAALGPGRARIHAYRQGGAVLIDVEDNAGAYQAPAAGGAGLGMRIVDRRIKNLVGDTYGVSVTCVPSELTRVTVRLPAEGVPG
jgi:two-component system LytT family sensor kinase